MTVYTNVPLIKQEHSMSCWHASARMIWGFKFKQSINPLKSVFAKNTGVSPAQFVTLGKTLGLEAVTSINMSYSWMALAQLLNQHGPLWAAGYWYGVPHIVVITGVEPNGTIYINDPSGVKKVHDMKFFNEKIANNVANPIMYLPDSRANQQGYGTYFK